MALSALATAIYSILQRRVPAATPEIPYRELVEALQPLGAPYSNLHWRDPRLDQALGDLVEACRAAGLPAISAIVVNGETRRPGRSYYSVAHPDVADEMQQEIAWARERDAVASRTYPPTLQ